MVNCYSKCFTKCYNKNNIYLSVITKILIILIIIFIINNVLLFIRNDIGINFNGIDVFKSIRDLFKKDDSNE